MSDPSRAGGRFPAPLGARQVHKPRARGQMRHWFTLGATEMRMRGALSPAKAGTVAILLFLGVASASATSSGQGLVPEAQNPFSSAPAFAAMCRPAMDAKPEESAEFAACIGYVFGVAEATAAADRYTLAGVPHCHTDVRIRAALQRALDLYEVNKEAYADVSPLVLLLQAMGQLAPCVKPSP